MSVQIGSSLGTISTGSGRLVVRTSGGTLYAAVNNAGTARVYSSSNGTSWTQQDSAHAPSTISGGPIAVAIDSTDKLHITYGVSGAPALVLYRSFATSTNLFGSAETAVSPSSATNITSLAIAVDSNDIPHLIESNPTTGSNSFRYTNRIGGTWKASIVVATVANGVPYSDLLIDNNNLAEISYIHSTVGVFAAIGNVNNAASFTTTNLDTTFTATNVSIGMDSSNNTWLSYEDVSNGVAALIEHVSGNAWSTWQTAINNGNNGKTTSIAVNGTNIYLFYEPTGTSEIAYDKWNGSSWLGQTIIESGTHHNPRTKWSQYNNNQGSTQVDFLFDDGTGIFWDALSFSLSISPSDSSTVTENLSLSIPILYLSVFDSSAVTENLVMKQVSVFDSSTVIDVVDVIRALTRDIPYLSEGLDYLSQENGSFILQEDGSSRILLEGTIPLAVTESITLSELFPVITETTTVTDVPILLLTDFLSVFDSSGVTENTILEIIDIEVISDSSTITDVIIQILIRYFVSTSDSSTVTENITVFIPTIPEIISDSSTITDTISQVIVIYEPQILDTSAVTENITVFIPTLFYSVSDSSVVTENRIVEIIYLEIISDSSVSTENLVMELANNSIVNDSSSITESILVQIFSQNTIVIFESAIPTEGILVQAEFIENISSFDSSSLSEVFAVFLLIPPRQIVFVEYATPTESISVSNAYQISVEDDSMVTENVSLSVPIPNISVFDFSSVIEQAPYQIIQLESLAVSPLTGTIKDNAAWKNTGWIRLTPAINNQIGEFEYSGTLPTSFEVLYDINIIGQANGLYFYWGGSRTPLSIIDNFGGYLFVLDEFVSDNTPYKLEFSGTQVSSQGNIDFADGNWHTLRLEVLGTTITVFLDNVQKFTFTDISRTLGGSLFGWGASTGGQNAAHLIRNTSITTLAPVTVIETTFVSTIFDSSTVTESITIEKILCPVINEVSTITDVIMDIIPTIIYETINDTTTVIENIVFVITNFLSVSDLSTVSENSILDVTDFEIIFDSSAVTDVITQILTILILNIFESSVVSESITVSLGAPSNLTPNVFESSAVTEGTEIILIVVEPILLDSSVVTDIISQVITVGRISTSNSSTVTEGQQILILYLISSSDSSVVTENSTVTIPSILQIISDSSTVTEFISIYETSYNIIPEEDSSVTENISIMLVSIIDEDAQNVGGEGWVQGLYVFTP